MDSGEKKPKSSSDTFKNQWTSDNLRTQHSACRQCKHRSAQITQSIRTTDYNAAIHTNTSSHLFTNLFTYLQ